MRLFLASEGKNPLTVSSLKDYVGGFSGKSIAYIPTAANGEGWGSWKAGGSWEMVQKLGAQITLVQLEEYGNGGLDQVLRGKDIIWMAGGYCGYLLYWIGRTHLEEMLPEFLKHSLYLGSSAGSMITAKELDAGEWYLEERVRGAVSIPGLDLVNFDIYPHYDESKLDLIQANYRGNALYLLKDGEHILFENGEIRVVGKERIVKDSKA